VPITADPGSAAVERITPASLRALSFQPEAFDAPYQATGIEARTKSGIIAPLDNAFAGALCLKTR
jgi:hypothetical protein